MADYYCDHGAYGLTTNRIGLDTPVWGVPQEGDGSSKDAATASSTGSILFGSVPTTGTIAVCGATVSTTGVIGAATVDAAANALATNINATTNTVSTTFANSGCPTNSNRLQNIVYARGPAGGAPAGTCQIMSRIGSATHNTTAIATTFDGSPTLTQFTGGSGGCWGWFINPSALGVSSGIAAKAYGAFLHYPLVGTTPTINDKLWCRTGGGASKSIALSVTNDILTHAGYSKKIVFDTNTIWTSDLTTGVLDLNITGTSWGNTPSLRIPGNAQSLSLEALRYGGFEIEYITSTGSSNFTLGPSHGSASGYWHMKNVVIKESITDAASSVSIANSNSGNTSYYWMWENVGFICTVPRATVRWGLGSGDYGCIGTKIFSGCIFDFNISGVSDPGPLLGGYQTEADVIFQGCEFKGYTSGYSLMSTAFTTAWATNSSRLNVVVDNCSGLKMPASYLGLPSGTIFARQWHHQITFSNAQLASQGGMRIEDCRGVTEWVPDDSTQFPYLSATLPGSGSSYSMRIVWIRAVTLRPMCSYEAPDSRMFTQLPAATRTLTMQMFVPSSLTDNILCMFVYIDSDGKSRSECVTSLSTSSASWTNAASYSGYEAKKFTVTTAYAVKENSEIVATLRLFGAPPGSDATVNLYYDPEFTVE